jgi:hypothetical protein
VNVLNIKVYYNISLSSLSSSFGSSLTSTIGSSLGFSSENLLFFFTGSLILSFASASASCASFASSASDF